MAERTPQELMDGIMRDVARAGALGLIPEQGAKISRRGEFIVSPDNVTDMEDKKMRGWRLQGNEYPKALNGWGRDPLNENPDAPEGPIQIVAKDQAHEAQLLGEGWSIDPVYGPVAETADRYGLSALSAKDAAAVVAGLSAEDLDAAEAEESDGKNRKSVLAAVADRRVELSA